MSTVPQSRIVFRKTENLPPIGAEVFSFLAGDRRYCAAIRISYSSNMAQTFTLRLLLAGQDDLICEVREPETKRLRNVLAGDDFEDGFFWFDTIDGRSIIVNTEHLQGARFLWDFIPGPPDSRINDSHEFLIAFVGKEKLSESPSEDPKEMYTLFWELELGGTKTVTFIDVDGEPFTLIPRQVESPRLSWRPVGLSHTTAVAV
ncbi:hypothetical protein QFZ42_003470 [Variovorax paradoxus]|uniref:hypothetical protein n=1 Tax=Variovorax paradoxus TaxID=34073 RepID=UPI00278E80EF|nr:hypothetical protein [Variovorax paradoxus]MDQ0571636.1 hypothetical protein [Variovorax paradoxus]